MRTFLADLWDRLRTSLWFVPALMAVASFVLALILVRAQDWVPDEWMYQTRWLASGDPDGARQILATIAGSVITVTGVIFSVTIVALSLASQQFGPRLLRNFMRDRGNQIVLGTFIGTFVYAMLVLRVVHEPGEDEANVPYLAVTFAVIFALIALGILIYFIHHVVTSIQADTIVLNVSNELRSTMNSLYGTREIDVEKGRRDQDPAGSGRSAGRGRAVVSSKTGYVRTIDQESLLDLAQEYDLIIHVIERPGKFVLEGQPIVVVHGKHRDALEERAEIDRKIRGEIYIGTTRTSEQDIEFSIAQLVEIAVRSLSPSLNDPFTAMACLDHLGAALADLGQRLPPKKEQCFRDGRLRLIIDRPNFAGMVNLAFDQIRQHVRTKPAVAIRMLEVIAVVVARLRDYDGCADPLLRQARMVTQVSEEDVPQPNDREVIAERYADVMKKSRGDD